jgi:hypothetical protein
MSVQSISQKKRLRSIAVCVQDDRKPASGTGTLLPAEPWDGGWRDSQNFLIEMRTGGLSVGQDAAL